MHSFCSQLCKPILSNIWSARKFNLPVGENRVLPFAVKCQVHVVQFFEHVGKPKISPSMRVCNGLVEFVGELSQELGVSH